MPPLVTMSSSSIAEDYSPPRTSHKQPEAPVVGRQLPSEKNNNVDTNKNVPISTIDQNSGSCYRLDSAHETMISMMESVGSWDMRKDLYKVFISNGLLAMMMLCTIVAWIFPKLGAVYVQPEISASWIAVVIIFFINGLSMDTAKIIHAAENIKFNTFIQLFNFVFVSAVCFLFSLLLLEMELLPQSLANGLVICSCLPQSICAAIVLTKTAGGDPATAMINAVFSNLSGIFLSPILIFCYLGVTSHVDQSSVIPMLLLKVALPFVAGQLVHYLISGDVTSKYDHPLKIIQEGAMAFIIFSTISQLFLNGTGTTLLDVAWMVAFQVIIMSVSMLWVWMLLRILFPSEPKFHATGLFLSVSKTMPLGIPMIHALYNGHPNLALFTLPLLVWYPLTIVFGILIAPRVAEYVRQKECNLRNMQDEQRDNEMMDYHQVV